MRDFENYSLKAHNTFGIEAKCSRFLEYENVAEAQEVAGILRESDTPYIIIGGGSNLLLTQDFDGIVVHSRLMGTGPVSREMQLMGPVPVSCGSGEVWDDVVAYCIAHGLYGMENLSLIPGDVGASAVQNIGAYGAEAKDLIVEVEAVEIASGRLVTFRGEDCGYGYRDSKFKHEWKNKYLITHVTYQLSTTFEPRLDYGNIRSELERKGITTPTAQQLRDTIIEIRNAKLPDPKVMGNAGSFFMNPIVSREKYETLAVQYEGMPHYDIDADKVKIPAGWMIDQCGWKGKSLGRAGVHDKQALVLVNRGGATGAEIVALCETIRKDVKAKFDIDIHPEVNII
ncbi:MAG: UDP-N-acetylmuramate dehydrogenase [Prevotella sp.]|nr:UDP-N-acetylmuramate dehydrogenase [Prevotella sp.]